MVKCTQIIRQQFAKFDHFVRVALKRVRGRLKSQKMLLMELTFMARIFFWTKLNMNHLDLVRLPSWLLLFQSNNANTRTVCEICFLSGAFIVNFKLISQLLLVFILLTLNRFKNLKLTKPHTNHIVLNSLWNRLFLY